MSNISRMNRKFERMLPNATKPGDRIVSQNISKPIVTGWQDFDAQKLIEGQMYLWKYSGQIEERIYAGSYMNYFSVIKPKWIHLPA